MLFINNINVIFLLSTNLTRRKITVSILMFVRRFRKETCGNIINNHSVYMVKLSNLCWAMNMEYMEEEKGYRILVGRPK